MSEKARTINNLQPMRNSLLATVGTSLLESNLKNLSETTPNKPENWAELKGAYQTQNWSCLTSELLKIDPAARTCGAEINTVEEIRKKSWLSLENLIFLVSDTPNGKATGKVLRDYFKQRKDLKLRTVDYAVIEELQDLQQMQPKALSPVEVEILAHPSRLMASQESVSN